MVKIGVTKRHERRWSNSLLGYRRFCYVGKGAVIQWQQCPVAAAHVLHNKSLPDLMDCNFWSLVMPSWHWAHSWFRSWMWCPIYFVVWRICRSMYRHIWLSHPELQDSMYCRQLWCCWIVYARQPIEQDFGMATKWSQWCWYYGNRQWEHCQSHYLEIGACKLWESTIPPTFDDCRRGPPIFHWISNRDFR